MRLALKNNDWVTYFYIGEAHIMGRTNAELLCIGFYELDIYY